MDRIKIYFTTLIILCLTITIVAGEYLFYRYNIISDQNRVETNKDSADSNENNVEPKKNISGSSENYILSFKFDSPMAVGSIYQNNHLVMITVPPITDITRLSPIIEISPNATILPLSGTPQDFTKPVIYKVTAENGSIQNYTVTVEVASILKSVEKKIISFKISNLNPEVIGYINDSNHTVDLIIPDDTDLKNLTPIIEVSDRASIYPRSGENQDFTNPIIYTVTDFYGLEQEYKITAIFESDSG